MKKRMKKRTELDVRHLSDKARRFYENTDPLDIYVCEVDGEMLYSVRGVLEEDDLSFEELEEIFEEEQLQSENVEKYDVQIVWYAVLMDESDNDWGTGSYNLKEAKRIAMGYGNKAYIAVIKEGVDPVCVDEIRQEDF